MVGVYAVAPWLVAGSGAAYVLSRGALQRGTGLIRHNPRVTRSSVDGVIRATGWMVATTGVGAIVARLDLLLIGIVAGAHEAGIFAAASTLALVPTLLGAYLAPAFSARILPYCRERRMQAFLGRMQATLLVLAGAGTVIGVAISPVVTRTLLPPGYGDSADVLAVLLIAGAAGFVTFPVVLHTLLLLSPRTYLFLDLMTLPILVPMYLVAARRWGAVGVAWVTAGSTLVKACIAQVAAVGAARRAEAGEGPWGTMDHAVGSLG
jgi:O-antigen/teichoic acid export membrane protein